MKTKKISYDVFNTVLRICTVFSTIFNVYSTKYDKREKLLLKNADNNEIILSSITGRARLCLTSRILRSE